MTEDSITDGSRRPGGWRRPVGWLAAAALAVCVVVCAAPAQDLLQCGQPVVRTLVAGDGDTYRLPNVDAQLLIDAADISEKPGRLKLEASSGEETQTGHLSLHPHGPTTLTVSDVGEPNAPPYTIVANVVSESPSNCASPLPCGLTPHVRQLKVPGAVDAYTFDGNAGDRVKIRAGAGGTGVGVKVQLRAFDPSGRPVADTFSGVLNLTLVYTGSYTVLVSAGEVPLRAGAYGIAMEAPTCPAGPDITLFGLATADQRPLTPDSYDDEGRPVYERSSRSSFIVVIEARPGPNGTEVGTEAYRYEPNQPEVLPDLQVLLSRPLGDGSPTVCDKVAPTGGVPAVPTLDFRDTQRVADAINDFGCRVDDGTGHPVGNTDPLYACTESRTSPSGYYFVNPKTTIQFCEPIYQGWQFSRGSTVLRARVADVDGVVGTPREIVVRVAGDEETELVKDIVTGPASSNPNGLRNTQGGLYFVAEQPATGLELWRSDGTTAGTRLVQDIRPGPLGSVPTNLTLLGSRVLFSANDGTRGAELWAVAVSSGSVGLVRDINPGAPSSTPLWLTRVGSLAAFNASRADTGSELWATDGTEDGTRLVADINPGAAASSPAWLVARDEGVIFAADDGTSGVELWASDLTADGTHRVRDIRPGPGSSRPTELTRVDRLVFFAANDGEHGIELWRSDGTEEGTQLVKDIRPGDSAPADLVNVGGTLFFTANDGIHGVELWRSDGTEEGTWLVRDIEPGVGGSAPALLTAVRGQLFFSAQDSLYGRELWRSDGTPGGTTLVRDIVPGPGGSEPRGLTNVDGILVFAAADSTHGVEPWSSDGSEGGTVRLADIAPGPLGSQPTSFTPADQIVFCAADNGVVGRELWALAPPSSTACAGDCRNNWEVTTGDLTQGVAIALGDSRVATCPNMDTTDDGDVTVDDVVRAVNASTGACAPQ